MNNYAYLAANYSRHPEMRDVRSILSRYNIIVTSRWIEGKHETLEGQDREEENHRFALEDIEDMKKADFILWFSSEGPENRGRGGRHVEFGFALAKGIPLYVIGRKENVFHYLNKGFFINHYNSLEEFLSTRR